ncbi:ABC transporter permease [Spirosoma sp. RP8]|uniref:ABC transporter permease n=1 Tax=Spirosoma liriopis TaxID=2937440 RepID=A0ABT0HLI3_9BACT|nr:ABC transporter permease [Spirosoma liriopis]MCK8492712.1 ABC transporter permease [Spirosoma liriopis]
MFKNYLKIAFRTLARRRLYALVTLLGLTIGITFLLLIANYIQRELTVNQSLRNAHQQYIVKSRWKITGMGNEIATLAPLGPTLKRLYPDLVANYYRNYGVTAIVSNGQTHFRESVQVGDSTLLAMYGFPLAYGDPRTALRDPNSIVVTTALAQKYFGETNVLGRQLVMQTPRAGKQLFTVTGVLQELPANSVTHLFDQGGQAFIPMRNFGYFSDETALTLWDNWALVSYLELKPGITEQQLNRAAAQTIKAYAPPEVQKNLQAYASPLRTYHLKANNGLIEKMVLTLALVALFILLMAVVNFVNITIGMSASRVREIGVRKALGGLKKQLVGQFLTEVLLLTAGATMLSLVCHELFRPLFASLLDKPLLSLIDWSPVAWLVLLGAIAFVTLLAGSYPAFVLSALPSVESLKGRLTRSLRGGVGLRRTLIVFQFSVAVCVAVGALIIGRQVTFFFTKELGYQKEQVMTVASVPRDWSPEGVRRMENARNQLARIAGVADVSFSFEIPDGASNGSVSVFPQGGDSTQAVTATALATDEQFAQTYGLQLKAGQFFTGGSRDSLSVVLNESGAKALGWLNPVKAVGQFVRFRGEAFQVAGVLSDFHFGSLHDAIRPLVITSVRKDPIYRYFSFKLATHQLPETVAAVEQAWSQLFPDSPFEYAFMDDTLQKLYRTELQLKKASSLATVLALVIVLLGVWGLVSLNVTRRTKEIGIRKTLGASTLGIVNLFVGEFVLILLIANVIAWPLAYYFLGGWLAEFAYRIELSWLPFAGVAGALVFLTGLVISTQAIRAALVNPVKSLRSE